MTLEAMLSPGLEGVPIAESAISLVDGDQGELYYRGYAIEDLTDDDTTFEEVVALLYDGDLPNSQRLADIRQQLEAARSLTDDEIAVAREVGARIHPMFALQA